VALTSDPVEKLKVLHKAAQGRAAHQREINATEKKILWDRIQLETPEMAEFMREAKAQLGAQTEEIKLNGKVVWRK
jgi:hypothetical protein